ncbi:RelA/SpoT domain-containing protein [[Kitasatospora] papulosa]|uniref:RelA/SpoT domain-containing protein n=1 Tax=[Kitasatospora] papulosa TaxID=1464011 RepID=UPI002E2A41EA|nr:RelA/SpoT domain-containing protein [[Kitasatospora] papulosa]
MDFIEQFIDRYTKEYDFYNRAARLVSDTLESDLRSSGIRCIVSHRAKDIERLREKCRQRDSEKRYQSVESIYADIVDLAGVRVALYFPGEIKQVESAIARLFDPWDDKRVFPDVEEQTPNRRFSGYSAVHYRVQPKEKFIGDADRRYLKARVEIQVASVLMHAWSEVQHDLAYKQMAGALSDEEHVILDQLNGLVIAGEVSLRLLQEAGDVRVARNGARFLNHYELAAHLLRHASETLDEPVGDAGLGKVDDLFALLRYLNKATLAELEKYLESLHGAVEERPLAEQVVDALLAEDSSRYAVYEEIRDRSRVGHSGASGSSRSTGNALLEFMQAWASLERLLNTLAQSVGLSHRSSAPVGQLLKLLQFPPDLVQEIEYLRRTRNDVVHLRRDLSVAALDEATKRTHRIKEFLKSTRPSDLPATKDHQPPKQ